MKKLIPLFIVLFYSWTSYGQSKFEIGMEAGPNYSSLYGNSFVSSYNGPRIGFYSGIGIQFNFSDKISLRTGIGMERKGSSDKRDILDNANKKIGQLKHHANFDYLSIPLMLRYRFGSKIRFFINAGPSLNLLMAQKEVSDARPEFGRSVYSNYDSFLKYGIGLVTGIGASYPLGKLARIHLEFRNNLGLSEINDYIPIGGQGIKMNALNALVGVSYGLANKPNQSDGHAI